MTTASGVPAACKVCGGRSRADVPYLDAEGHPLFRGLRVALCAACGFGEALPKVDPKALRRYYEEHYRSPGSEMHIEFDVRTFNPEFLDYRSVAQLMLGRQFLAGQEKLSFMDIGAGPGFSFASARKLFPDVRLFSVEPNRAAGRLYRKLFPGIVTDVGLDDRSEGMDLILMSHSLEHFDCDDVPELFETLSRRLRPGGVLVIEVPSADLRDDAVLRARRSDSPHLSFFSLESLRRLAGRSGLEPCFVNSAGRLNQTALSDAAAAARPGAAAVAGLKKALVRSRGYRLLRRTKARVMSHRDFYANPEFHYGGDREMLRCVLRKAAAAA